MPAFRGLATRSPIEGGGEPLVPGVKRALEASFDVNLDSVRVHYDGHAHTVAETLGARAFAYGNHIFLGAGESKADLGLLAHETAHVVQQQSAAAIQLWSPAQIDAYEYEADRASSAVLRGDKFSVAGRVSKPRVQRSLLSRLLDKLANWAYNIPGFRLLTVIMGKNPINWSDVDRSAANILRGLVELIPGGHLLEEALDKYGVFEKLGGWLEQQVRRMESIGSAIKADWDAFVDDLDWTDIRHPGKVWDDAVGVFTRAVQRIGRFALDVGRDILKFIKDAILMPLAKLAEGTRGWDLLIAVLGKNPITGEPVPRTAENLIGGFMKLIGQEEVWENIKKSHAIPRAWAWFQGALKGVISFVSRIPSLFIDALKSLTLEDIIILPKAFIKVGKIFGGFLLDFISWAGEQVWTLLQIIFEVVAPAVMPYLKKAAAAFRTILKHPGTFVGHLVKAAKEGFHLFATHFLAHLQAALVGWLTGTLEGANIYIPQGFTFMEIIKFVLSVLGLTWQNIRAKLVKVMGETAVKALETGFDLVVTLVTQGPAAAWEKIQEGISNLKQMVIDGIMNFVRDRIVQAAVTKLLSMLSPAGAFIQAIIAIYNTVMFFIERLKQIGQVAAAFIDSISAIANGIIGPAAQKVESTLGGLLTLVVSFLARLVGLGKVSDAIKDIINKIREPIDKALDRVVDWIVTMAKKAMKFFTGDSAQEPGSVKAAAQQAVRSRLGTNATVARAQTVLPEVLRELGPKGLKSLTLGPPSAEGDVEVLAEASPRERVAQLVHKKIIVAISAQIQVKGEPVLTGILRGPQIERTRGGGEVAWPGETMRFSEFHEEQKEALGGTGRAATLPPVPQPPRTAARKGDQPSAGLIVEPPPESRELEVLAWNTSQPNRGHNTSHAERQFIEWFDSRPFAWRRRVVSVQVDVEGRPVCPLCERDLVELRARHSWITNFTWTGAPAPAPAAPEGELLEVES